MKKPLGLRGFGLRNLFFEAYLGAGRGGRTPTRLPSADFESAASASSAIPALNPKLPFISYLVRPYRPAPAEPITSVLVRVSVAPLSQSSITQTLDRLQLVLRSQMSITKSDLDVFF